MSTEPSGRAAPSDAYRAATTSVAVFDDRARALLTVTGRSPTQMLNGVITGRMPAVPSEVEPGVFEGSFTYHTVLTPKGKIISDLQATLLGSDDTLGYLLDVPEAGRAALLAHFGKFLPPRFAKVREVSGAPGAARGAPSAGGVPTHRGDERPHGSDEPPPTDDASPEQRARLTVVGPNAADLLSKLALGLRVDAHWLERAAEGAWRCVGDPSAGLVVARTADVWPPAFHVYGTVGAVAALGSRLVGEGAVVADPSTWEVLRVEAGRPAYGVDMDDDTLPPEAGIVDRAIDHAKGCYTGQEVIVRIRDRGHVNWQLRRLDFGNGSAPEPGAELVEGEGSDKVVARVTSVVRSPRAGATLALAYVRRETDEVAFDGRTIQVPDALPEPL